MIPFIIRRILQSLIVLILVSGMIFFILRMLPGDPVTIYMSQSAYAHASAEQIAAVKHEFGLDRPVIVQYASWISNIFQGDFGKSIVKRQPVFDSIRDALPKSLHLGILSFIISNSLGIPIGVICAARRGKRIDTVLTVLSNIGITAPTFWVGILLMYIFSVWLGWLPSIGYTSPFDNFGLSTKQLIMPVFCLSLFPLASTVRQTRSAMLEVIAQDYIRTAWSKGLKERSVIFRHALKNGILPVVTLAGINLTLIVGGEVIVETVFGIPGIGYLAVDTLLTRDYPTVEAVILVVATAVVLSNLIVDITYGLLDPRIVYK